MKRCFTILVSLILLVILLLSFQTTTFAASLKGSSFRIDGSHRINGPQKAKSPDCPSIAKTPNCAPYPPCTRTDCYNLDPYTTGCGGPATAYNHIFYTQSSFGFDGISYGYVTNYYSSWCNANWAVVTLTNMGYKSSVTTSLSITGIDSNGNNETMSYYSSSAYPLWTNMIDGKNQTDAYAYASAILATTGLVSLEDFPTHAYQ